MYYLFIYIEGTNPFQQHRHELRIFRLYIWNKRKNLHSDHTSYDTQLSNFKNLQKSDSSNSEVRWRSKLWLSPKDPPKKYVPPNIRMSYVHSYLWPPPKTCTYFYISFYKWAPFGTKPGRIKYPERYTCLHTVNKYICLHL